MDVIVGGIRVSLPPKMKPWGADHPSPYRPFFTFNSPTPEFSLHWQTSPPPPPLCRRSLLRSSHWTYGRTPDGDLVFHFSNHRIIHLNSSWSTGRLWSPSAAKAWYYPLDQCLFIHLFSKYQRLLVHAAGILHGGKGLLLLGNSGAGKTTCARLWQRMGGRIVSDERVVVYRQKNRWILEGTPWPGTGGFVSADKAELAGCIFLHHGLTNTLQRLTPGRAAANLFRCAFFPTWIPEGLSRGLALAEKVAKGVPSWDYHFRPDPSALEHLIHTLFQ